MKSILVTTDFSEGSKTAVENAMLQAKKSKASLEFMHVISTPIDWLKIDKNLEQNYPEILKQIGNANELLNELVDTASKEGIDAKKVIHFNLGVADLCYHIDEHQYDMVVIGAHKGSSLEDGLIGSNTQKILRNCKTPVLVIKPNSKPTFNTLLFVSNFEDEAQYAFQKALEFAELNDSEIHLLYVNVPYHFEDSITTTRRMKKFEAIGGTRVKSINIFNAHGEEKGILAFAEANAIDIISLTTHGKSGIMLMLAPSIAESLANHSSLPILSTNVKKE